MKRSILMFIMVITAFTMQAQNRTSSPYSFFGLGQPTFRGTIENRMMAGIRTFADSTHVNLQNPAAYGSLRLTNYAVGAVHTETWASSNDQTETYDATAIEYISIGIPVSSRAAFGFGLVPFKSVGYFLGDITDTQYTRFKGEGSLSRAYLAAGYKITDNLSLGAELRYNFGEETNSSSVALAGVQLGTNEVNETDLSGLSYNLGLHYQKIFKEKYELQASFTYEPSSDIGARNNRTVSTFILTNDEVETTQDIRLLGETREDLKLPSQFTLGISYGEKLKWALAAEYTSRQSSVETNRSFSPDNATFIDASSYRLGGFYIPNYNSISSYWDRVTYRAGARFEETGLLLRGEDIAEFGITFGLGLPVGRTSAFSNANIGFEYGQRGTTKNGLLRENFFSISLGLSLNDKWFRKREYN